MKRPMLVLGISCAIATWASFLLDAALLLPLSLGCVLAGLALYPLRARRAAFLLLAVLLSVGAAFGLRWRHERARVAPLEGMDGRRVRIEGVVTEMTAREGSVDYLALVRFPEEPGLPGRATLTLRSFAGAELLPGDAFACEVTVRRFLSGNAYNRARGAFVRGNIDPDTLSRAATGPYEFTRLEVNLREGMAARLRDRLDADTASLLEGMLLGRDGVLPDETYRALNRSGAAHLLAVSGLHLSILTGLLVALLTRLRCPPRLRHAFALLGGFGFCVLVGLSASIFRAFVMLAVYHLAHMLPIPDRSDSLSNLGLSLLLISLLFPAWTLSAGIWLSAGATAGIVLWSGKMQARFEQRLPRRGPSRRVAVFFLAAFATSLAAYALSAPVLMLTSGWVSLVAPLVNLFIAPLVPVILGGGMLLAAVPGAAGLAPLAGVVRVCSLLLLRIAGAASAPPFAIFPVDRLYRLVWVVGAGLLVVLLVRLRPGRSLWIWTAAACSLCLVAGGLVFRASARDRIEVAAVEGCSQVVLLRGGEAVILGTPSQYEIGALLRYLEYRGVRRVSAVVATDCGDRVGSGLLRLAGRYEIGAVFGPRDDYVLGQLEAALPGPEVLAAGRLTGIYLLEGAVVYAEPDGGAIHALIGGQWVSRTGAEAEALALLSILSGGERTLVGADGSLYWADGAPPQPEPLGALLFGETRLSLRI